MLAEIEEKLAESGAISVESGRTVVRAECGRNRAKSAPTRSKAAQSWFSRMRPNSTGSSPISGNLGRCRPDLADVHHVRSDLGKNRPAIQEFVRPGARTEQPSAHALPQASAYMPTSSCQQARLPQPGTIASSRPMVRPSLPSQPWLPSAHRQHPPTRHPTTRARLGGSFIRDPQEGVSAECP